MSRAHLIAVLLAALGAVCIVTGAALIYVPAAFLVGGVTAVIAAYVVAWMESQR